jgi:hypothetical protein
MKRHIIIICALLVMNSAGLFTNLLYATRARVIKIRHQSKFERIVKDKSDFVILLFYDSCQKLHNTRSNKDIKMLQETYRDASARAWYHDAGLKFVMMDIAHRQVADVVQQYNITKFPTLMLFKFGYPIMNTDAGTVVTLSGFVTEQDIHYFIRKHLEKDLNKMIEEKRVQERDARTRRCWSNMCLRYSPYYGYPGWPYYYYGFGWPYYYYSHPRVDVGFGLYW